MDTKKQFLVCVKKWMMMKNKNEKQKKRPNRISKNYLEYECRNTKNYLFAYGIHFGVEYSWKMEVTHRWWKSEEKQKNF